MAYVKRIYISGVGYTSYLTELNFNSAQPDQSRLISVANGKSYCSKQPSGSQALAAPILPKVNLNFKIGYSDIKVLDITPYITDKDYPVEILVVGKEILTTPGYQDSLLESGEGTTNSALGVVSPIKAIIIIRGSNKEKVNSLAALIRNLRPYSVYKGIGLRLQGEPLTLKPAKQGGKNKQKAS